MTRDDLAAVTEFARALDREDYAAAGKCLAADCRYSIGGELLVGPAAILASYRENGDWARGCLDAIAYESRVKPDPAGGYLITYLDHLEHAGRRHKHRCQQCVNLDGEGLIAAIEHRDLPGEKEALAAFFRAVGIERKS